MSQRSTHYWLWFLLFGLVAGLITYSQKHTLDSESLWLLISGLLGIVAAAKWLNEGKFARPYDLIIGVIFAGVGVLGLFHGIGFNIVGASSALGGAITSGSILGLSLGLFPSLIHTVLGFTSLSHGARQAK